MVDLQTISLIVQMVGVSATATAAVVGVNSYINSNKRTVEAKKKEQETRDLELETRQAQLFMQIFNRYDGEFWRDWLQGMSKEYKNYDEWNRDRSDQSVSAARLTVSTYMQGIGTFVKRGLLSREIVADMISGPVIMWWQKWSEYYKEYRIRANYPTYADDLEYLYDELMKLKSAGYSPKWSPEQVARSPRGSDN